MATGLGIPSSGVSDLADALGVGMPVLPALVLDAPAPVVTPVDAASPSWASVVSVPLLALAYAARTLSIILGGCPCQAEGVSPREQAMSPAIRRGKDSGILVAEHRGMASRRSFADGTVISRAGLALSVVVAAIDVGVMVMGLMLWALRVSGAALACVFASWAGRDFCRIVNNLPSCSRG